MRKKVVPAPAEQPFAATGAVTKATEAPAPSRPPRLPWAALLARTVLLDVLRCPCGGERRVLAFIPDPRTAQEALRRLGLPSTAPVISPPRWASQDEFDLPKEHSGAAPPFYEDACVAS